MKQLWAILLLLLSVQNAPAGEISGGPFVTVRMNTDPPGLAYTVDGTTYHESRQFSWLLGSLHLLESISPQGIDTTERAVFDHWSDLKPALHTVVVVGDTQFTGYYKTQFLLSMKAGKGGSVTPATGWQDAYHWVEIHAIPDTLFALYSWTGTGEYGYSGTSITAAVYMAGPVTEEAAFVRSARVGLLSNPPGLRLGEAGVAGSATVITPAVALVPRGSLLTLRAISPQPDTGTTRYLFRSWSDQGQASHAVIPLGDTAFIASFRPQYFLTLHAGDGGRIVTREGWFDSGATAVLDAAPDIGFEFDGWIGSGPGAYSGSEDTPAVHMLGPVTETAHFRGKPAIDVSVQELPGFGQVLISNLSKASLFSVSARYLLDKLTIAASRGLLISLDDGAYGASLTLAPSGGSLPPTPIFVRFLPNTEGPVLDSLLLTSEDAIPRTVYATGTGVLAGHASTLWVRVSAAVLPSDTARLFFTNMAGATYGRDSASPDYHEYEPPPPPASGLIARWSPNGADTIDYGGYPIDIHGVPDNALRNDTFLLSVGYGGNAAKWSNFALAWPNAAAILARCDSLILVPLTDGLVDLYRNPLPPTLNMTSQQSLVLWEPLSFRAAGKSSFRFMILKYGVKSPDVINTPTSLRDGFRSLPKDLALFQNFPNPFNPSTTISYALPAESDVKLTIFDLLGREIARLVDTRQRPGEYSVTWSSGRAPSGVYFYRLQAGKFSETRKLSIVR